MLIIILFTLVTVSCASTSQKIAALKPEPDDAVPLTYSNTPSYINLPVSIKLKDIEKRVIFLIIFYIILNGKKFM